MSNGQPSAFSFLRYSQHNPETTRRILDQIDCEESFLKFFRWVWRILEPGTRLIETRSFGAQIEHAQAMIDDQIDWLAVNVWPGDGKSYIWSRVLPVYWWVRFPHEWLITGSHEMPLATSFLVDSRRIMTSPEFQERWAARVTFAPDQNAKTFYETIQGGRRQAVSTGGGLGKRARVGILDDSQTDAQAHSPAEALAGWTWLLRTFIPRLNSTPERPSKFAHIQQRLCKGDNTDRLLDHFGGKIHLLCLPTRYVAIQVPHTYRLDDPKFRHIPGQSCTALTESGKWKDDRTIPGQLLCPERYTEDAIRQKEKDDYYFAAQEQQMPHDNGISGGKAWPSFDVANHRPLHLPAIYAEAQGARILLTMDEGHSDPVFALLDAYWRPPCSACCGTAQATPGYVVCPTCNGTACSMCTGGTFRGRIECRVCEARGWTVHRRTLAARQSERNSDPIQNARMVAEMLVSVGIVTAGGQANFAGVHEWLIDNMASKPIPITSDDYSSSQAAIEARAARTAADALSIHCPGLPEYESANHYKRHARRDTYRKGDALLAAGTWLVDPDNARPFVRCLEGWMTDSPHNDLSHGAACGAYSTCKMFEPDRWFAPAVHTFRR